MCVFIYVQMEKTKMKRTISRRATHAGKETGMQSIQYHNLKEKKKKTETAT